MLSKLFEWYRIAEVSPEESTLTKRKSSVEKIIGIEAATKNYELVMGLAEAALTGFSDSQSNAFKTTLEAVSSNDLIFPKNIAENAQALQATAAIAVGEIILQNSSTSDSAASSVLALSNIRDYSHNRFLAEVVEELRNLSIDCLESSAIKKREREKIPIISDSDIDFETAEIVNLKPIFTELANAVNRLSKNTLEDQEELQVLSWLYSNYSSSLSSDFDSSDLEKQVVCFPSELAALSRIPIPISAKSMLARKFRITNGERSKLSLQSIIEKSNEKSISTLLTFEDSNIKSSMFPRIFPITWLFTRLKSSKFSNGWESEFQKQTLIEPTISITAEEWAIQVLDEAVALRCSELQ